MSVTRSVYPFTALVGQELLKRALLLAAINPRVGGVLIRGEKGTAKSTAVRALARLLPTLDVAEGCPYNCAPTNVAGVCPVCRYHANATVGTTTRPTPLVELPVSASEDRVVGSLDLEHAITEGQRRFEPGLLAQANRGILYVDEVNLLDDHLVDLLLDAAAMGVNTVEREGISVSHPARFILIGTMNPEEGELRPQLLDRFGLAVEIAGLRTVSERVAVIERRMAFEEDAAAFSARWHDDEHAIAQRLVQARALLPQVAMDGSDLAVVAGLVLELGVDGHRADLTILEAARTNAAFNGRTSISTEDIQIAAELALPHRMHRQPFAEETLTTQAIAEALERSTAAAAQSEQSASGGDGEKKNSDGNDEHELGDSIQQAGSEAGGGSEGQGGSSYGTQNVGRGKPNRDEQTTNSEVLAAAQQHDVQRFAGNPDQRKQRRAGGRRSRTRTHRKQGRYITSEQRDRVTDLAFDATLREAAPYQRQRRAALLAQGKRPYAIVLNSSDMRQKVRVRRTRNAVCFVVDASWSMAAEERMQATKAAVLSLLRDAYQRRDQVGLVSFQRTYATVLLPLTSSVELAQRSLQRMPTGGKTPLTCGLLTGYEVLERARRQDPEIIPLLVVITDGQANVAMGRTPPQQEAFEVARAIGKHDMRTVVIDTEHPHFNRGLTRQLATHLRGTYYHLNELSDDRLAHMVRTQMGS